MGRLSVPLERGPSATRPWREYGESERGNKKKKEKCLQGVTTANYAPGTSTGRTSESGEKERATKSRGGCAGVGTRPRTTARTAKKEKGRGKRKGEREVGRGCQLDPRQLGAVRVIRTLQTFPTR